MALTLPTPTPGNPASPQLSDGSGPSVVYKRATVNKSVHNSRCAPERWVARIVNSDSVDRTAIFRAATLTVAGTASADAAPAVNTGLGPDLTVTVPAGEVRWVGPFPSNRFALPPTGGQSDDADAETLFVGSGENGTDLGVTIVQLASWDTGPALDATTLDNLNHGF